MNKSIIAVTVIAVLSFNAVASELEANEPVDNSSSMSTSDKVAAGIYSAAAVGIAFFGSSSSSYDGGYAPDEGVINPEGGDNGNDQDQGGDQGGSGDNDLTPPSHVNDLQFIEIADGIWEVSHPDTQRTLALTRTDEGLLVIKRDEHGVIKGHELFNAGDTIPEFGGDENIAAPERPDNILATAEVTEITDGVFNIESEFTDGFLTVARTDEGLLVVKRDEHGVILGHEIFNAGDTIPEWGIDPEGSLPIVPEYGFDDGNKFGWTEQETVNDNARAFKHDDGRVLTVTVGDNTIYMSKTSTDGTQEFKNIDRPNIDRTKLSNIKAKAQARFK